MGVERSEVRFEIDDAQAKRAARDIKRDLNDIEREAGEAQRAVDGARSGERGLGARFKGLLKRRGFEVRDEDITLGEKFKIGASGISVRETFKKGQSGGGGAAVLRGAFWASFAAGAADNTLSDLADLRQELADKSVAGIVQGLAQNLPDLALQTLSETFRVGNLARNANRLITGEEPILDTTSPWATIPLSPLQFLNPDYNHAAALSKLTGIQTDIDYRVAKSAARQEVYDYWRKRDELKEKGREAAEKAREKVDDALEKQLARLKTQVYRPKNSRVNRDANQKLQRRFQEAKKRELEEAAAVGHRAIDDKLAELEGR